MNSKSVWLTVVALGVLVVWFGGCSTSGSGGGTGGVLGSSGGGSSGGSGAGLCAATCDKPCGSDTDCDTSSGQGCCDFGGGKVCAPATSCPRFCTNDTACNTTMGEGCELVSLQPGAQKVCEMASQGIQTCHLDSDCTGANTKCCSIYSTPFCTPENDCPTTCTMNAQCNTAAGEICCSTVSNLEHSLAAKSLCLQATACPKSCASDSDCSGSTLSPLCCDGICSATCPKSCSSDNDCTVGNARICCGTIGLLPSAPTEFHVPSCTGTPFATTCQSCAGCTCPGCTTEGGTGVCEGSAYTCSECSTGTGCGAGCPDCVSGTTTSCTGSTEYTTCASCPTIYCGNTTTYAGYCPGCTLAGTGNCTGTQAVSCATFNGSLAECEEIAGCTYTGSACTGTPTACSSITSETTCDNQIYCSWSGTSSCTGTITPCSANTTSTACEAEYNCIWESTACSGTPQACGLQTTQAACSARSGCDWYTGVNACSGVPMACATLDQTECQAQPGCLWN